MTEDETENTDESELKPDTSGRSKHVILLAGLVSLLFFSGIYTWQFTDYTTFGLFITIISGGYLLLNLLAGIIMLFIMRRAKQAAPEGMEGIFSPSSTSQTSTQDESESEQTVEENTTEEN